MNASHVGFAEVELFQCVLAPARLFDTARNALLHNMSAVAEGTWHKEWETLSHVHTLRSELWAG
eukprot:320552-Chlamydomonas_euryale.AAC.22